MKFYYRAFGLSIESDIYLPQLQQVKCSYVDLKVVLGFVASTGLRSPARVKPHNQQAPGQLWLDLPNVARFLIANDCEIRVYPYSSASQQEIALYVMGTCLGVISHLRNKVVVHGNAIKVGEKAVIIAGDSGHGKSTLAAAFHSYGYQLLADDVSVIDGEGRVQPSYPQMKLSPKTAEMVGIDVTGLEWITRSKEKYAFPLREAFCDYALPVCAVYILNLYDGDKLLIERVSGAKKLVPIRRHIYRRGLLKGLGLKNQQIGLCADFADRVDVKNIYRPRAGYHLGEFLEAIIEDLSLKA